MRSKNMTAAEKHYEKILKKLNKTIKDQSSTINALRTSYDNERNANMRLVEENTRLQDHIERLLEYTELDQQEIKKVFEADKQKTERLNSFFSMSRMFGGF